MKDWQLETGLTAVTAVTAARCEFRFSVVKACCQGEDKNRFRGRPYPSAHGK